MSVMSARSIQMTMAALAVLVWSATATFAQTRWQASYSEPYGVLVVRNADGRTMVVSRSSSSAIEVVAQRADGSALAADAITIDKTAPGVLSLRVPDGAPLTQLEIFAPVQTHLSIQGGGGTVIVQGAFGGLAVETGAGAIVVQLPPAGDADVTFTTSGEVVCTLALTPSAGNAMPSGRLGRGGPRYDLRSAGGKIFLLPFGGESATPPMQDAAQESETGQPATRSPAPGPAEERRARGGALRPATRGSGEAGISVVSQMVLANVAVGAPPSEQSAQLTAADFAVLDQGQPQQIAYFAPVDEPLDLILLLDLSGSTKSKFNLIKKAAERFVDALSPQDRVAVCAFTTNFMIASEFTADRKLLRERIRNMKHREGGTRFYRALWLSLEMMAKVKGNRKAIVVMTDGVDNALQTGSNAPVSPRVAELLEALRAARAGGNPRRQAAEAETDFEALLHRVSGDGVSIFPVYINTEYEIVVRRGDGDSMQYQEAREQLEAIASVCGTTIFKADRIEDLDGAYARVAAELHNLYTVGFYPTDAKEAGAWHDIAVNVSRPGFTARTRRGYYVD